MIAMSCLSSCADPEGAMEVFGTSVDEQVSRVRLAQFPFEFGVSMATTRVVDDTIALTLIFYLTYISTTTFPRAIGSSASSNVQRKLQQENRRSCKPCHV